MSFVVCVVRTDRRSTRSGRSSFRSPVDQATEAEASATNIALLAAVQSLDKRHTTKDTRYLFDGNNVRSLEQPRRTLARES
ncbi:MAG: hypothetical protein ACRC1H_00875, partial [Caldilineaceae bacterium]